MVFKQTLYFDSCLCFDWSGINIHTGNKMAVAVFQNKIKGEVLVHNCENGLVLVALFTQLPPGRHGFHIHKAGDLRGGGCAGMCEHFDLGTNKHGGDPTSSSERHTGDLGNIEVNQQKVYCLQGLRLDDIWGRSVVVHANEDDLGKGLFPDSKTTGHSGDRIGCAIFGRSSNRVAEETTQSILANDQFTNFFFTRTSEAFRPP